MKSARLIACSLVLVVVAGCGQAKMMQSTGIMRQKMIMGDWPGALATLHQAKKSGAFKEQDRVMFWMNEGMLLHLLGRYDESTAVLEKADKRVAELFTKSISKNLKAAFTSEGATDYQGEDYEKIMINVIKALNFMNANKLPGALVEARKINAKLLFYNAKYKTKNVYNQDAFAHWLMGLLFETEKSYDDARIAYAKAIQVYEGNYYGNYSMQPPPYLYEDLLRIARLNNDNDLLAQYKAKYGNRPGQAGGATADTLKTSGEVVVFHLNGEGPTKSDYFINCIFKSAVRWFCDGEPGGEFITRKTITLTRPGFTAVKIAFPRLHVHPTTARLLVSVAGASGESVVAEPLSRIAVKVFRDHTGRIFKNAIIRGVTKALTQAAAGAVGKKVGGGLLGFLSKTAVGVANQATEEADKRTWTALPAHIDVARVFAPPGTHNIELRTTTGRVLTIPNIKVEAGKRVFITYRTIP